MTQRAPSWVALVTHATPPVALRRWGLQLHVLLQSLPEPQLERQPKRQLEPPPEQEQERQLPEQLPEQWHRHPVTRATTTAGRGRVSWRRR